MKLPIKLQRMLFPKKEKLKIIALREERVPLKTIQANQLRLLKKIVKHAYEHVPHYRDLFDKAGIKPSDIKTLKDIKKIPITEKDDLRKVFPEGVTADNVPKSVLIQKKSSGSTGKPFAYYEDLTHSDEERKGHFRMQNAMGLELGDTIVRLRSGYIRKKGLVNQLAKHFGNTKHISTVDMTADNMGQYVEFIRKHKPKVIESFPHHIFHLADYMEKKGITLKVPTLHLVGGNANEKERERLQKLFNCSIYNHYGSGECMAIAYQCEKLDKYHMEIGRYIIEIIHAGKDAKDGEVGEILLTNLYNYGMPFIRYRIQDVAIAGGKCDCDRTYPVFRELRGRLRQSIILPNGILLDPNVIDKEIIKYHPAIQDFQLVFTKDKVLELLVVPTYKYDKTLEDKMRNGISRIIKNGAPIKIIKVKKIKKYGEEKKSMRTIAQIPPDLTDAKLYG